VRTQPPSCCVAVQALQSMHAARRHVCELPIANSGRGYKALVSDNPALNNQSSLFFESFGGQQVVCSLLYSACAWCHCN
jgi:hypothetical protein